MDNLHTAEVLDFHATALEESQRGPAAHRALWAEVVGTFARELASRIGAEYHRGS